MKRAMLGGVEITVVSSESTTSSATVTDNPVEKGQNVSDHMKQEPSLLSISGVITGDNAREQFERLKDHKERGRLVGYIGKERYSNMAIENITKNYDKSNKTGFSFSVDLKQVRIATAKTIVVKKSVPKKVSKPTKPVSSRGRSYLRINDRGSDVKKLQADMNKLGYNLAVDGILGPATKRAVTSFQKKYKLKVDGLAGTQTFNKISQLLKNKSVTSKTSGRSNKGKQQTKKR